MREALELEKPLPPQPLASIATDHDRGTPLLARLCPRSCRAPGIPVAPAFAAGQPITHYAASAALEPWPEFHRQSGKCSLWPDCLFSFRLRAIFLPFLRRSFEESGHRQPAFVSRNRFCRACQSFATLLKNVTLVSSLVGDPFCFLQVMAQAAQWLEEDRVDSCLVIGAEETNWITADALWHFDRAACISAGAGAVCLCREPDSSLGVELDSYYRCAYLFNRKKAGARPPLPCAINWIGIAPGSDIRQELLCDGLGNSSRTDAPGNRPPGAIGPAPPQPKTYFRTRPDGRRSLAMRCRVRRPGQSPL